MSAPDRSEEVFRIWEEHPPTNLVEFQEDEDVYYAFPDDNARRTYLLETMLPELHKIDEGWGYLIKIDRDPPYIPSDIAVWKDTMEHFDILTDRGPIWIDHGVVPSDKWIFGKIDDEDAPPVDLPPVDLPPLPEDAVSAVEVFQKLNDIEQKVNDIMDKLEHYDREFKAIQPQLLALLEKLGGGLFGGLFGGKK